MRKTIHLLFAALPAGRAMTAAARLLQVRDPRKGGVIAVADRIIREPGCGGDRLVAR